MYDQLISFFRNFIPLDDKNTRIIRDMGVVKHIKKNDFVLTKDSICNYVIFTNSGCFRSFYVIDGQEYSKQFFMENQFCSDYASFLTQRKSNIYIQALEDSQVIYLYKDKIDYLYETIPNFLKFGKLIAESLFIKVCDIKESFIIHSPEERYKIIVETRPEILQRIPQYMIASYLGITPETLSRIRKRIANGETTPVES